MEDQGEYRDSSARVLLFDIETSPLVAAVWGIWGVNVPHIFQEWSMLSYAWCWLDDPENVQVRGLPDFTKRTQHKRLARELHALFDEADVIIAHNGDKFDIRKSNTMFIEAGLTAPRPYKTIDTLKIARQKFAFTSNRLDDLGQYLGVGEKLRHEGMQLWIKCMDNQPEAWQRMLAYNVQDVHLLHDVYWKLLTGGWIDRHPNMAAISKDPEACPKCIIRPTNIKRDGIRARNTYQVQEFKCLNCNSYFHERLSVPQSATFYK